MADIVNSSEFVFSKPSEMGIWSWKIKTKYLSGLGIREYMSDLVSPLGRLGSVDLPVPSDILTAMYDSLLQVRSSFLPALSLGVLSKTGSVTAGGLVTDIGVVPVSNTGAFGSFLDYEVTSDSDWLRMEPSIVRGLSRGAVSEVRVFVDPSGLLDTYSPYEATLFFRNINTDTTTELPVTITVFSQPTIGIDVPNWIFQYSLESGDTPPPFVMSVYNAGEVGTLLDVQFQKIINNSPWLAITPSSLSGMQADTIKSVTFSIIPNLIPGIQGLISEEVRVVSSNATNTPFVCNIGINIS